MPLRPKQLPSCLAGLILLAAIALAACTPSVGAGTSADTLPEPGRIESLQDLRSILKRIADAPPDAAQRQADQLYDQLVAERQVPLALGTWVAFFFKGEAEQVHWRGAFSNWQEPGARGERVGDTDLWVGLVEMPTATRSEYQMRVDGADWQADPANPDQQWSGLSGQNSLLTMPGFAVTDEGLSRTAADVGTLTGDRVIDSESLGYAVNYRVYTPSGYANLKSLPVMYLLDGNDFVDERMGAIVIVLDNMIASGRVQPLLAVLIDARDPADPGRNRREEEFLARPEEYARFITEELVPVIDAAYRTDPRPEARVIVGVSYGGVSALYIAAAASDVFGNLAAMSPAMWVFGEETSLADPRMVAGIQRMRPTIMATVECGGETGHRCPRLPVKFFLTAGLPTWDVGDLSDMKAVLEGAGYPVELHQVREGHSWAQWRGLTDELLEYFFGSGEAN